MIPITRKELYLNKIVGNNDYETPEKPITTEEFFFAEILGEAVQVPEPLTRYQLYLAKIAGRNIETPYPETRLEYFLARAAGMDVETPTPITREEILWSNYTAIVEFELEGVPPLTFGAVAGTLKNYRIYGNTVDGESVGDRTANLFANLWKKGYIRADNGLEDQIDGFICSGFFPVEHGHTYSISRNINVGYDNVRGYRDDGSFIGAGTDICDVSNPFPSGATKIGVFTVTNENVAFIRFNDSANDLGMKYMIVDGTYTEQTMPAYEPYGYEVPVMINNVTTNLYLPEPIKMVGDEAEYIDYREQKMHKVRKNLLPVVATSKTVNGVIFTVNADKSVTCNGTNKGTSGAIFEFNPSDVSLEIGESYIVTGCPEGGKMSGGYTIQYYNGSSWSYEIGHGATFTALGTGIARPRIIISTGVTVNNLTFYPMIRKANIEDDTYEPYIENTDLDVTLPALPTLSGTNTLSVGTTVQPSKVYIKGEKRRD